jgi:hypothetical protein
MKPFYLKLLIAVCFLLPCFKAISQVPGFINRPATIAAGRLVLDPNSDGYTSVSITGFGANDVNNSEIPYNSIRAYSIEPYSDLGLGPSHGYSDFVPDSAGNGVYHYFSMAQNVLFRMRMGAIMPGSKGYSILMDTDGKFGATGANADPNYLPSTSGTNGNPGFEIEVVLETNLRIAIYNADGTSSPVLVKQYLNWQNMSQVSIASTNDNGDPDYLIDFYIPFSDLQAAPFNLTTATPIRMCATTVMSPQSAIGGPRSDIYGTGGNTYEDFINGQPACNIFTNPVTCPTAMCTAAPAVNSPISTGTVNISGTWTKSVLSGATTTATITVYKNGTSVGTVAGVTSGTSWTLNSITLINGDIITAKALATGETMCLTSNAVAASTCNSSNIPPTPALTCTSGSKGINGTNLTTGWTVHVDNITRNVLDNSVTNGTGLFGANTGTSPNLTWQFSGGCSAGAPLSSGSYKIYYTNAAGCNSLPAYFCAAGNGGNALAGALPVPVITAPANAVFTTATKTISGTTTANATATLYINTISVQTVTATGGVFNFTGLNLLNGQQLYIVVELNTGVVATSMCANQTPLFTVTCFTNPPLISADNNNQLTAGAPITGTSTEPVGTTIRVYTSVNVLVATSLVQANGTWSTGNAGTTPATYNAVAATSYYANAQNGTCGLSGNSAGFATLAPTSAGRCGSITGPIASGVASISGTLTGSFSTSTVNLYLDGQFIGSTVTSNTAWGPITVNSTINNTLYPNGVLSIGIQESGKQEVLCPASSLSITCSPTPVTPVYSPAFTSILRNQTVTYSISNAFAGSFYALADSATGQPLGQGIWATVNGGLSITTNAFTTSGTFKVVFRSTSLSGVTQCSALSSVGTIIVSLGTLPLTLIEFKGKKQADDILLEWITATETHVNRFEIERSSNGSVFEKTGTAMAAGNSSSNRAYAFTDTKPNSTVNYYRLKMIDDDGRYTYSNVIVFMGNRSKAIVINNIKPNPFTETINLDIAVQQAQPLTVQLINMTGSVVSVKQVNAKAGNNDIVYNGLAQLADGIYYIRIITADAILQQKVLKIH